MGSPDIFRIQVCLRVGDTLIFLSRQSRQAFFSGRLRSRLAYERLAPSDSQLTTPSQPAESFFFGLPLFCEVGLLLDVTVFFGRMR